MLAKGAGSTSGKWRTSKVEIARGPMLAGTEPGVSIITAMVATQLLKTALIETAVGYHAHLDPCPMAIVQPKDDAAESFSKERIGPYIKATPVLREAFGSKQNASDETLTFKPFPGGFLAIIGAGSPDNLARRPLKLIAYDEIDKYQAIKEGDQLGIGDERLGTFHDGKSLRVCSPTVEGESKIEASYLEGDQRRASINCPHCATRFFPDFFQHVEWHTEANGTHQPKTAQLHCGNCGAALSEGQRLSALDTIRWHQTRHFECCDERQAPLEAYVRALAAQLPDPVDAVWDWWASERHAVYRATCSKCRRWAVENDHASFQAGKLFSPWPRDAPSKIAKKWLDAGHDDGKRMVFWNTQLGLPYKLAAGKEIALEGLAARAEIWAGVPDGVSVITFGADTQDDRVEIEFVGWGKDEESWSLGYEVVEGDPALPEFWRRVDAKLLQTFRRADGREFEVAGGCIDSGGHHTERVYQFAKARLGRKVWAIKGASERSGQRSPIWPTVRPTAKNRTKYKPTIIGTNSAKDVIRARLALETPGAGYMHFPAGRDINYYAQLTAERQVPKTVGGRRFRVWELPKGKANEALDCRVYAYAALAGLTQLGMRLNMVAEAVTPAPAPPKAAHAARPNAAVENGPKAPESSEQSKIKSFAARPRGKFGRRPR